MPFHRNPSLSLLLAVAGAAAAIAMMMSRRDAQPHPAAADRDRGDGDRPAPGLAAIAPSAAAEGRDSPDGAFVRPAGPEAMRDPPRRGWDAADEASDESFPASDPPGNY